MRRRHVSVSESDLGRTVRHVMRMKIGGVGP